MLFDKKEIARREGRVQELQNKFELLKVNLCRENEGINGEGVWAVPLTEEDNKIAMSEDPNDAGKKFTVVIMNQPIYDDWESIGWGGEVVAQNNGSLRPFAYKRDNNLG